MRSPVLSRVVVATAATVALTGCGSVTVNSSDGSGTSDGVSETHASTRVGGGPGDSGGATAAPAAGNSKGGTGSPGGPGDSGGTGSSGGDSSGGGHPAPKPSPTAKAAADGPRIVHFRVRQKPSCPAGTNVNPIAGTPVVLEWQATNVDKVALSVDGPGIYADSYAPTGSETLNFPCEGAGGDTQKHTYQLTVSNAHGKQTRTLTVSARVNDIPSV